MSEYLKLISSFDEFAEDAKAGVVYYHAGNNVYYWLNLRTIWGYIGYNTSTRRFVYGGVDFSVVPRVPNPENLTGPVRIDKNSFNVPPAKTTFLHSDFNVFPVQNIYQIGNGKRLVIECDPEDTLPNGRINLVYESGFGSGTEIEYKNLDYSTIEKITSNSTSNTEAFKLVIGETNNVFSNSVDFYPIPNRESPISSIICEKDGEEFDETMVFSPVGVVKRNIFVETGLDTIVVKIHNFDGELNTAFRINCVNKSIILDGSQSNGAIGSNFYSMVGISTFGRYYFSDVQYRNVTDYGGYYKACLHSATLLPFPEWLLEMCKTDFVSVYAYNLVDDASDWTVISNQVLDLEGVKYFCYYENISFPSLTWNSVPVVRTKTQVTAAAEEYGRFRFSTTAMNLNVICTQQLSNVNLDKFSFGGYQYVYIKTTDSEVVLGELQRSTSLLLGDTNVVVSGTSVESSSNRIIYLHRISDCRGKLIFRNMSGQNEVSVDIGDQRDSELFYRGEIVSVVDATSSVNPTALDYYNTNIEMYSLAASSASSLELYDYFITRMAISKADGSKLNVMKIKCLGRGGDFTRMTITSAEHVTAFCNAIPERQQTGTITITRAQRNLFTTEQITHIQDLGYTVVVQEQ